MTVGPRVSTPAPLAPRGRSVDAARPAVMATLDRTDDSFYAGNCCRDLDAALAALDAAVAAGADLVDVGGVPGGQARRRDRRLAHRWP